MADEKAAPTKAKKAAHRSPNYPAFDLAVALGKIRLVYNAEKRTPTTREVIAEHLGYSNTDGPGGRALSCIRQFAFLEDAADKLRVSDLAFSLLHLPDDDPTKPGLLRQVALRPNLYRSLHDEYPDRIPSDSTLRSNLLNRGFNPESIDGVIADFKSTMELAKVYDVSDNGAEVESKMQTTTPAAPTPLVPQLPVRSTGGARNYSFALSPDARAELTLQGDVTPDDLELLRAHIELTIKALARTAKVIEQ